MNVVIVLSCPQDFLVSDLRSLSERICKLSLNDYQFRLGQKVVEDSRHGKLLSLGDNGIAARDTLVLLKVGSTLNITNPKVSCMLKPPLPVLAIMQFREIAVFHKLGEI